MRDLPLPYLTVLRSARKPIAAILGINRIKGEREKDKCVFVCVCEASERSLFSYLCLLKAKAKIVCV